jgi:two-component system, OmpR family, sensor histidine kinase KdpD
MTDDRPDHDIRPSPEALLAQTAKESRGRLKVFLGAAPGVGKTYEMLTQARQRRLEGIDTVIGVVETHGRIETDLLTKGFETIPKKRLAYKGRVLAEMDIDAILQRRPKLVLVDELAHTNAPSSRHPKCYMDVEEILAAGIDVYTTLNVQHLESLNDVVAKITRIRVRETVPDSILDRADDVELVDLTPEDLLQRLKEGKVYVPTQAERAVRHYFMPGNLTALRELALRRTAQRVDDQMVNYMRAHAIQGPWEASERVLVSVSERPGAVALVRYARRLADRLRASWAAINVETAHTQRLSETERDRVAEALRVAQRLGGVPVSIPASNVAEGVIEYARANNFTHIVVSTAQRSRWSELIRGSAAHEIIRRAGDISVHVVPEERTAKAEIEKPGRLEPAKEPSASLMPSAYAGSLAMVAVALGIGFILRHYLGVSNVALVFLTAVLASAVTYGLWPALFACLVSVLAFNFFFLPPLYTFVIADRENVITLVVFAVVAVIASHLTARVRAEAVTAQLRAKVTEELYLFSRKLTGVVSLDDLLWATAHQIALMLKVRVVLLLPERESIAVRAGYPPEDFLDDADLAAAKWAWDHVQPAGRGADTLPGAKRLFLPMRTGRGRLGIIGLDSDRPGPILSPDQRRLLDALSDQAALAIERVNLMQDIDRARLTTETERLRTALLTSISHDLRTPLASILGSATSLKAYRKNLSEEEQDELIGTIQDESERLNRFINNLLDMTRLESGALALNTEATDLVDVVGSALRRTAKVLSTHQVNVELDSELPMIKLDAVLLEQVLFNLLDNAAKYSPEGSEIRVRAWRDSASICLEVLDEGDGIPPGDLERIFDKFYRVHAADRQRAGTGLGLAICRGFIEAMGGTILARNRTDRTGAAFTIALPAPANEAIAREKVT